MKTRLLVSTLLAASLAAPALAADTVAKAPVSQQQRMKDCNAEAKTRALKGDERKTFMSGCLRGQAAAPAVSAGKQAVRSQ